MSHPTTTLSAESARQFADAASMVQTLSEREHRAGKHFTHAHAGLTAGIEDENEDEITLYRPQLARVREELDECMIEVQVAQDLLAPLRDDAAIVAARGEQIEKFTKSVALARKTLAEWAQRARELEGRVDKALERIRRGEVALEVDLGALRIRVKVCVEHQRAAETDSRRFEQAARKAFEKKDQKALIEARTNLIDLQKLADRPRQVRREIEDFKKQYPDLGHERKVEVQWLFDEIERVADIPDDIARRVKDTIALGQVPVEEKKPARAALGSAEVLKVVKTFGLPDDAGKRSKVARLLAEEAVEQWPRALAKLYGCKEAELKAHLGDVRKLPFVRPLALIDL